eukprot:10760047-Alexandrium_andersonii.AAC.1
MEQALRDHRGCCARVDGRPKPRLTRELRLHLAALLERHEGHARRRTLIRFGHQETQRLLRAAAVSQRGKAVAVLERLARA